MKFITRSVFLILFPAYVMAESFVNTLPPNLQGRLVNLGEKIVKVIYNTSPTALDAELKKIPVLNLLKTDADRRFLDKLKGKDISLIGKKSDATPADNDQRMEYLAKIVAVIWYIHNEGLKQGVQGTSVSYKIVDDNNRLYNFLKRYVDLAKNHASSFAYDRNPQENKSSHYKEESPDSQFGIDVRFNADQAALKILPFNKEHLLFGSLNLEGNHPPLTFVKFEKYGIGSVVDVSKHGVEYLKSITRSDAERENKRVENVVPADIKLKYGVAVNCLYAKGDKSASYAARTITQMYSNLKSVENKKVLEGCQTNITDFIKDIVARYPKDGEFLKWRSGNEVIIKLNQQSNNEYRF